MSDEPIIESDIIDPELAAELERLNRSEQVQDLYLNLITECERRNLPVFQSLTSWNLEELLYGPF